MTMMRSVFALRRKARPALHARQPHRQCSDPVYWTAIRKYRPWTAACMDCARLKPTDAGLFCGQGEGWKFDGQAGHCADFARHADPFPGRETWGIQRT